MSRIEDLHAILLLRTTLEGLGLTVNTQDDKKGKDLSELPEDCDIILLCSPVGNIKSRSLAEDVAKKQVRWPFEFCMDGSPTKDPDEKLAYIVDTEDAHELFSPMDISDDKSYDYALVARHTDTTLKRRVFVFWGIKGVGTLGAVKFVLKKKNLRTIWGLWTTWKGVKNQDFGVVLRIGFSGKIEEITPERITTEKLIGPRVAQ